MSRYVDADTFEVFTYTKTEGQPDTFDAGIQFVLEKIDKTPTADVAPVIHAHWIPQHQTALGLYPFECSHCGRWETLEIPTDINNMPYCHCGAKMDEVVKQ